MRESLLKYQFLEKDKKLVVHYSKKNDTTTDIMPELKKQFSDVSSVMFNVLAKLDLTTEPSIISNNDNE